MCGIVGVISDNPLDESIDKTIRFAVQKLSKRGPDFQDVLINENSALGHARLSILDTSEVSNQPMLDATGRYSIVFNGEIFNFKELRQDLIQTGVAFNTDSDTEVLLQLLIKEGKNGILKLNGFFAFCFWDNHSNSALLARDRFGIKPLLYRFENKQLIFASEIKAILPFQITREINFKALNSFFRYNYIPAPESIFTGIHKVMPACLIEWKGGEITIEKYYSYYPSDTTFKGSYGSAVQGVRSLLIDSTHQRMISDVPLGSFLSGGVDSSIVSAIAAKETKQLNTFSIGFKDQPQFDETKYANEVAKHIKSNHTVFSLSNDDLLSHFEDTLTYLDEPFADSSALNMFILSKRTKEQVTVALSGDGADEMFSGYNKHEALFFSDQRTAKNQMIKNLGGIASILPKSRNSKWSNKFRQLDKYHKGLKLTPNDRYLEWASFMDSGQVSRLLKGGNAIQEFEFLNCSTGSFNDYLYYDFNLVLEGDMLRKVDSMSMANGLEVRSPFMDYRLVDYVFSLPPEFKIDANSRKKILKDAFKSDLPSSIFSRGKKGFEVPLQEWFKNELASYLDEKVFNQELIIEQGILNWKEVLAIKQKLHSSNPNEAVYNTWALLSFQHWYNSYVC
jgi:asparagine synthase (glutamine-hydrolysing)